VVKYWKQKEITDRDRGDREVPEWLDEAVDLHEMHLMKKTLLKQTYKKDDRIHTR